MQFICSLSFKHTPTLNPPFLCIHTGDVEIGLMERNGGLEVEVVQARGLTMKPGSKRPPGQSFFPPQQPRQSKKKLFDMDKYYRKKKKTGLG